MRAKISIDHLSVAFPGKDRGAPLRVLEGITLDVRPGEFVCVVGPSGCGKSTLLNVVGGFLRPTSGRVLVDGNEVTAPNPRRIFIFQENTVFPWLTVEENIGFGLGTAPPAERARVVAHYIGMTGLRGFERAYPRELSGGMKQRVELARALAADPDTLFMDEPFGALDYLTRLRMRAELVEIWRRERKTVLFVTHDVEESVQLADRVVVMTNRPGTISRIIDVPLPRPRDPDAADYLATRDEIFATMDLDRFGLTAPKEATSASAEVREPPARAAATIGAGNARRGDNHAGNP